MLHIAVCDDEKLICSQIEKMLADLSRDMEQKITVEIFHSGEELYRYLDNGTLFDLILLDIELKGISGVEVGKKIRMEMYDIDTKIAYISAKEIYAINLFQIQPIDFLIKPITPQKLKAVIETTLRYMKKEKKFFEYKIKNETYRIQMDDILYFESIGRKIKIVQTHEVSAYYGKIEDIFHQIETKDFIQMHQSYLVNHNFIMKYQYESITLIDGATLPISEKKRKSVRAWVLAHEGGR